MTVKPLPHILIMISLALTMLNLPCLTALAQEVDKGKIPADQLTASFKKLAWGSPVWDIEEAIAALKKGEGVVWIDTRPESFFKKGTIHGASLLIYNKKGKEEENTLTPESLEKTITEAGLTRDTATVAFFCQGPECHRSYNATHAAVTEWGYNPDNIVWFRAGYPLLFKVIKADPKLKRKAKRYISDEAVKQL